MTNRTKKKILSQYYDDGLPILEILSKHRDLSYEDLKQIILEENEK
jgi:uncharacterized protein (DUF433 family)